MDFDLSDDQRVFVDVIKRFADERIAPFVAQWERDGEIPRALLREAGVLGLGALYVPEDQSGIGLSRLDATLVFEALSTACPSVAAYISIHNMCVAMVAKYGSENVRETLLPDLMALEKVAAYCLTEPDSGSDAAALKTRFDQQGDIITLNGTKAFVSGGGFADVYIVMCRQAGAEKGEISSVLVPSGTDGLSFGARERKMGWKAQPTAQVQLDGCVVNADNLLGVSGRGFGYALEALDGGRLNIAACALGGAETCLRIAINHMGERKAFGRKLAEFQALRFRLADMETSLQAARSMLRHAAWSLDCGRADATKQCAMAKLFVTDAAFDVANNALQLLGGYGYLEDFGVEKIVRDLRVHQILEGTNEIMRLIISRKLLEETA